MSWRSLAVLAAATLALNGCATIFTGTTDTLTFDANVPGVRLTIDGQYVGELPITLPMSRNFVGGKQFIATFEKAGYVTQEFKLAREFNAVSILDVSSPLTSGGVDVLTGSLMKFSPRDYHVQMLQVGQSATSAEFRRVTDLYRFALVNFRSVQKDLARGGGEHLAAFATAVSGGDARGAAVVSAEALRNAALLLGAATAPEFLARVGEVLAASPGLAAYTL
jgi:sarcosine oxidase gamma subunit